MPALRGLSRTSRAPNAGTRAGVPLSVERRTDLGNHGGRALGEIGRRVPQQVDAGLEEPVLALVVGSDSVAVVLAVVLNGKVGVGVEKIDASQERPRVFVSETCAWGRGRPSRTRSILRRDSIGDSAFGSARSTTRRAWFRPGIL